MRDIQHLGPPLSQIYACPRNPDFIQKSSLRQLSFQTLTHMSLSRKTLSGPQQQTSISWSFATPWMLDEAVHVAERRKGSSLPVLDVCAPETLSRRRLSPPALLPDRPVQTGDFLEWTNRSVVCDALGRILFTENLW